MTNDYKQKLFDYITGQYEIESPSENEPLIEDKYRVTNNIEDYVREYINNNYDGEWSAGTVSYFRSVNADGEGNQYIGCLCFSRRIDIAGYITKYSICICDSNFIPLKVITRYKSGTEFKTIIDLNVAEDGTLYGIEELEEDVQRRFIMLNNIFLAIDNNFYADLRYSLNIPTSAYNTYELPGFVRKCNNESKYIFVGDGQSGSYSYLTYLEINVGEPNVWRKFQTTERTTSDPYDLQITKNGDNYDLSYVSYYSEYSTTKKVVTIFSCSTSQNNNTLYKDDLTLKDENNEVIDVLDIKFKNENTLIALGRINAKKKAYIIEIQGTHNSFSENIIDEIAPIDSSIMTDIYFISGRIKIVYDEIFLFFQTRTLDISITEGANKTIICKIYGNNKVSKYIEDDGSFINKFFVMINKQYNLYKYYVEEYQGDMIIYDQIWNDNNYNGVPYQDFNSLIPHSTYFKDGYGIQFARNVLNNTYINNIETSTVQIPNLFINNLSIVQSNLIGITNNKIIEDNSSWQKNIYEEVYVNFINQHRVLDRNTEQQKIMPIQTGYASNDIVSSLEMPQESYDNIKLTKYRINYADNTTKIGYLSIVNSENTLIKYVFNIFVNKEILTIDLISEDENTIYLTIENNDTLELNKNYSIAQEMTIE